MLNNPMFFLTAFVTGVSISVAIGLYRQPENRWKSFLLVILSVVSAWAFASLMN